MSSQTGADHVQVSRQFHATKTAGKMSAMKAQRRHIKPTRGWDSQRFLENRIDRCLG